MKKLLMVLVMIGLLGGGGAYFYFGKSAEASPSEETKAEKAALDFSGVEFVELSPLILPIIDKNGVSQTLSVVVAVEVGGQKDADMVKRLAPKLADAYIQDMYGVLNKHAALKGGVVQVGTIKNRLKHVSSDILGDDIVKDVLLQVVSQRRV